jgi:hypothetical protein
MRDSGIEMPDITFDAEGQPVIGAALTDGLDFFDPGFQTALASCRTILAEAGEGVELQLDPELIASVTDQLNEFSICMRDSGVELWPDPLPTFTGSEIPFPMAEMAAAFADAESPSPGLAADREESTRLGCGHRPTGCGWRGWFLRNQSSG